MLERYLGRLWPYSQKLDLAGETCHGQTFYKKIVVVQNKSKFITEDHFLQHNYFQLVIPIKTENYLQKVIKGPA